MGTDGRALWSRVERARVLDVTEPNGRFEVFLPRPNVHVTRGTGYLTLAMALRWIELIEPVFEKGAPLSNHHQWLEVTGYESLARRATQSWALRRASRCLDIQFVSKSKLVAMGFATVNLATALTGLTIRATTSAESFDSRLAAALFGHDDQLAGRA